MAEKLTLNQRWALATVGEHEIPAKSVSRYGRTYWSLHRRGLISQCVYANGLHWAITYAGRKILSEIVAHG